MDANESGQYIFQKDKTLRPHLSKLTPCGSSRKEGGAMAAISFLSHSSVGQQASRRGVLPGSCFRVGVPAIYLFRPRSVFRVPDLLYVRAPMSNSRFRCMAASASDVPTVSETKKEFLQAYKRPIPSVYSTVLQELLVQQHLLRYKRTYQYDAVFALGFVTVYDQLLDGYPNNEDRELIFKAYIEALKEDPEEYRNDAQKLEEWARSQNATSLVEFASREGEVEAVLKDISERAGGKGNFSYSRFFAIGLFRLLELASATETVVLEKICGALNVSKRSVDTDLDVYRNLLSKLVQAKELLKEYVDREKKKRDERAGSQKANEAIKNV